MTDYLKKAGKPNKPVLVLITLGLLGLGGLEYWALAFWIEGKTEDKVTAVLAIVGAYGIGLGFFRKSKVLRPVTEELIADLTSPNAAACLGSNLLFLGIVLNLFSIALSSGKAAGQSLALSVLSMFVTLAMASGLLVYVFFHALVVVPIAYPAMLIAGSVVLSFEAASGDVVVKVIKEGATVSSASLKSVVLDDKVAATAFIVGLPATALALITNVVLPFFL